MLGTIVNTIAVMVGSLLGVILKSGISDKYKTIILQGNGLAVILIGLKMAFKANNELIVIISLAIGGIIGEFLKIDYYLDRVGYILQEKTGVKDGDFVKGFVTASIIMGVGAMALMGALESGITGNHKILYAKSTLDFITSTVLSASLGIGVLFSAIPVFLFQGSVTLVATWIKDFLTDPVVAYMSATGGLLIVGIGLNILGLKKINIANLLPAIFVAIVITILAVNWFPNYV